VQAVDTGVDEQSPSVGQSPGGGTGGEADCRPECSSVCNFIYH